MKTKRAVSAFLGKHGFDFGGVDVGALTDSLLWDMEEGLSRVSSASSLDMIPTWTSIPDEHPRNTRVIAIDAGGTNLRSSLVSFGADGNACISLMEKTKMPASDRMLSKAEFFDALASCLDRLKDSSPRIGFCFSYAMNITPDEDGTVIQFSKEIKAPEVIGARVGAGLMDALRKRGWRPMEKMTLINDTKAALLSGAAVRRPGVEYDSFVGFILGTGLNAAYIESGAIAKAKEIEHPAVIPARQIVVCESGKFTKAPQCGFDKILDAGTATPGTYLIEKMCSGAYIGPLATLVLNAAAREGLFSAPAAKALAAITVALKDMDRFLWAPWDKTGVLGGAAAQGTDDDYAALYLLLDALVERASRISAAIIAAAVIKSNKGANPARPVCVTIEGTTVQKTRRLREKLFGHLCGVLHGRERYFDIVTVDDAITLGAAIAACAGGAGN